MCSITAGRNEPVCGFWELSTRSFGLTAWWLALLNLATCGIDLSAVAVRSRENGCERSTCGKDPCLQLFLLNEHEWTRLARPPHTSKLHQAGTALSWLYLLRPRREHSISRSVSLRLCCSLASSGGGWACLEDPEGIAYLEVSATKQGEFPCCFDHDSSANSTFHSFNVEVQEDETFISWDLLAEWGGRRRRGTDDHRAER